MHFEKIYGSRKEAYFIEQAILNETLNQWVHPTGLAEEWEGLSELRRLDISELESIHSYYDELMDEMGCWQFAAAYVSMTQEQRESCLSRS